MTKPGRKSVNISHSSSGEGVKEDLKQLADQRAIALSRLVEQVYTYAVENKGAFPPKIKNPKPKPGKHISTNVPERVATHLTDWAKSLGRRRSHHCCFILEVVLDDKNLQKKVLD